MPQNNPVWSSTCRASASSSGPGSRLAGSGTPPIQFRCVGTVSQQGRKCALTSGTAVELSIGANTLPLAPGCGGGTQCMTTRVPANASFKDTTTMGGPRLLCDAMGYPAAGMTAQLTEGSVTTVAVVQTAPLVQGTGTNSSLHVRSVECVP